MGFVSRAWRPVEIAHAPVDQAIGPRADRGRAGLGGLGAGGGPRRRRRPAPDRQPAASTRSQTRRWMRVAPPSTSGGEVNVSIRPPSSSDQRRRCCGADPVREQARLDMVGDRLAVDLVAAAVGDERGERGRLLLGRAAGHVVGREARPAARTHDPDHRAARGVGQQAVGRVAHRVDLGAVIGDRDPAPQAPAADQRMRRGAVRRPSSRGHRRVLAEQALVLELGPQVGRDGVAGTPRRCAVCWAGDEGARDDRRDRRMAQRELQGGRRQRHAVALADGLDGRRTRSMTSGEASA